MREDLTGIKQYSYQTNISIMICPLSSIFTSLLLPLSTLTGQTAPERIEKSDGKGSDATDTPSILQPTDY